MKTTSEMAWPIDTDDQVEALARECDWDNRKYMWPADYAIWCERMRKFARLASLSVQPPAAVVGEPVGMGVFRNGEMIGFVGIGDEFKLPEDKDERRPIYAAPSAPDGWRPIASAPKEPLNSLGEGPTVLLFGGFSGDSVRTGHWKAARTNSWCDTALGRMPMHPTHWKSLPAPPALGGKP